MASFFLEINCVGEVGWGYRVRKDFTYVCAISWVWWCCWSEPALALRVEQADHFCLRSMQPYCWLGSTSLY